MQRWKSTTIGAVIVATGCAGGIRTGPHHGTGPFKDLHEPPQIVVEDRMTRLVLEMETQDFRLSYLQLELLGRGRQLAHIHGINEQTPERATMRATCKLIGPGGRRPVRTGRIDLPRHPRENLLPGRRSLRGLLLGVTGMSTTEERMDARINDGPPMRTTLWIPRTSDGNGEPPPLTLQIDPGAVFEALAEGTVEIKAGNGTTRVDVTLEPDAAMRNASAIAAENCTTLPRPAVEQETETPG